MSRADSFTRAGVWALAVEGLFLLALGVAGVLTSVPGAVGAHTPTAQTPTEVLGFQLNPAHSAVLIITGVLAGASLWHQRWRRRFAATQTIWYMLLYVFGLAFGVHTPTATMWDLNTADHVLHAVLFVLGLTLTLVFYSSSFEPPIAQNQPEGPARQPDRPTAARPPR
jgi:hypothetical protein